MVFIMKSILVFLVFFMSSNSLAINYFRCDKTNDCAKAYGGCGRYFSVHKRYKELYEAKAHKGDRVANCLAPTKMDKKYKFEGAPVCNKNRCRLELPKKKKEEAS